MELGVPCEFTKYGCDRIKNWGKGPAFPDERMPASLRQAGIRYFDTHQNALPWLFLGHIIAHCEVPDPAAAQLVFVPYPIMSLNRAVRRVNMTLDAVNAHYAIVKNYLGAQRAWGRCGGCDHVISIEAPADRYVKPMTEALWGGYFHEDPFWARTIRLGHHHGILSSEMNAKFATRIATPFNLPVMSVPFTLGFLPQSAADLDTWLEFAFAPDLPRKREAILMVEERKHRVKIIRLCKAESSPCSRTHALGELYFSTYRKYMFSIQPGGDVPTRRAFFDSLLVGTIPIIFDPATRIAGRADGYKEDVHQHYRLCYAKYFRETGWGTEWLDKVALIASDEEDAMRLVRETPAARISEMQANIREFIPRFLFWDHTAPAEVAAAPHVYTNVSVVPTALRLMAADVQMAIREL